MVTIPTITKELVLELMKRCVKDPETKFSTTNAKGSAVFYTGADGSRVYNYNNGLTFEYYNYNPITIKSCSVRMHKTPTISVYGELTGDSNRIVKLKGTKGFFKRKVDVYANVPSSTVKYYLSYSTYEFDLTEIEVEDIFNFLETERIDIINTGAENNIIEQLTKYNII
jgi:hypothetical protein